MLSVDEALARILAGVGPLPPDIAALAETHERVLAQDLPAKLTQPPFPSSAMDGYAVRKQDVETLPAQLDIIGESAAGHPFSGQVGEGQTVRIFTGAAVPQGADHIVIQENVTASDGRAEIHDVNAESFIRQRGADFAERDVLLRAGKRLTARDLMLAAQMNYSELPVRRRPKIAILASGDELVPPGGTLQTGEIVSSIPAGLAAMLRKAGADPQPLGIAKDTMQSLAERIEAAKEADVLVTIGGASVGDHDLVRKALEYAGYEIGFHKIAMRPGKPLMSGARGTQRVIGLPGNPVSAMICGLIFLLPLISAFLGEDNPQLRKEGLPLAAPLPENGSRQHYMRAAYVRHDGEMAVAPLPSQDSSLTLALANADCLIVRAPHAPVAQRGETVAVISLTI